MDYLQVKRFWSEAAKKYGDDRAGMLSLTNEFAAYRDACEKETFLQMVPVDPGWRCIELGCGTGRWSNWLAGMCRSVVGIDLSKEMLQIAKRNAPPNVDYIQGRIQDFDFDFDLIYFASVLQYLTDDDVIKVLSRVPAGATVITRDTLVDARREISGDYNVIYRTPEQLDRLIEASGHRTVQRRAAYELPMRAIAYLRWLPRWAHALTKATWFLEPLAVFAYRVMRGHAFPERELRMIFTAMS